MMTNIEYRDLLINELDQIRNDIFNDKYLSYDFKTKTNEEHSVNTVYVEEKIFTIKIRTVKKKSGI